MLQEVARSGRQWDESIPASVLADESFADLDVNSSLFGDLHWQGGLERSGELFVLQGAWKMHVPRQCGRCNVVFSLPMSGEVDVTYALAKQEGGKEEQAELELTGHEPELLSSAELDVLQVLREHFWLAWQPLVVCSEACKGLCLQCGVDLNKGGCDCHKKVKDNAFAALKDFKFDA
jgi:uncharacterized protein